MIDIDVFLRILHLSLRHFILQKEFDSNVRSYDMRVKQLEGSTSSVQAFVSCLFASVFLYVLMTDMRCCPGLDQKRRQQEQANLIRERDQLKRMLLQVQGDPLLQVESTFFCFVTANCACC